MAETKRAIERPLSPHLGIYRMQINMLMSIVHRITGSANYVGTVLLAAWLVSIAMGESWGVCNVYKEHMVMAVATVIGDGVAAGVFKTDNVALAAKASCTAMMRFFHPQLIEQWVDDTEPNLDQMIDFVLASLGARAD